MAAKKPGAQATVTMKHLAANLADTHEMSKKQTEAVLGELVGLVTKYLKKGDKVYVEGRIEYRTWEDREKQTRYVTEIIARELIMLGSRGGAAPVGAGAGAGKGAAEVGGKAPESLDAFPEALDEEDDDLPF